MPRAAVLVVAPGGHRNGPEACSKPAPARQGRWPGIGPPIGTAGAPIGPSRFLPRKTGASAGALARLALRHKGAGAGIADLALGLHLLFFQAGGEIHFCHFLGHLRPKADARGAGLAALRLRPRRTGEQHQRGQRATAERNPEQPLHSLTSSKSWTAHYGPTGWACRARAHFRRLLLPVTWPISHGGSLA